jgi:hypothetical protein
MMEKVEQ